MGSSQSNVSEAEVQATLVERLRALEMKSEQDSIVDKDYVYVGDEARKVPGIVSNAEHC